jgi:hypothetical protein
VVGVASEERDDEALASLHLLPGLNRDYQLAGRSVPMLAPHREAGAWNTVHNLGCARHHVRAEEPTDCDGRGRTEGESWSKSDCEGVFLPWVRSRLPYLELLPAHTTTHSVCAHAVLVPGSL